MVVDVRLLGPPRVVRDGVPARFDTRKAVALLAYLALSDRPRPREAVCELLWPDLDPENARGALRRTLSVLRAGLGSEHLDTSGDTISMSWPGLSVDARTVAELATDHADLKELEDVSRLMGGEFLEGFSVKDSPEFDHWQEVQAEQLRRQQASLLRRLVQGLIAVDDLHAAIPVAERWLALDPLHEPAHQQLIRLLAWTGHRAEALEQYRKCVRILHHELGVRPVTDTAILRDQIDDGTLPPPPADLRAPARQTRRPAELPLVGRTAELAALRSAYQRSRDGTRLAVIEGEPGIGKTRLAQELSLEVRAGGGRVLWARAYDGEEGIPYGPLVELLRVAVPEDGGPPSWLPTLPDQQLADAAILLPYLTQWRQVRDSRPLEGSAAKVRLLDALVGIVSRSCRGPSPALLVVDDVHAADGATLDAVHYLVRRLAELPALVVLIWRSMRIPPGHRLRSLLSDYVRMGMGTVVRPERLSADDVAALASSAGYDQVAQQAYLESEGLPLFAAEYLTGMRFGRDDASPLSAETRGLLRGRLASLGDLGRQVLDAAAVLGGEFSIDLLRAVSGRAEEEAVTAVEELLAEGILREVRGDPPAYQFTHSKLAEMASEEMSLARRRLLHRRAAQEIGRLPQGVREAAQTARHLQEAGAEAQSAEQHHIAATRAAEVQALEEAIGHLEAALALGHPESAQLYETVGDLATLAGDYLRAFDAFQVASLEEGATVPRLERKIGDLHQRRGEWKSAERRYRTALQLTTDPAQAARVSADLALTLLAAGRPQEAAELTTTALKQAESAGELMAQAQAHNIVGVLAHAEGDLDRAARELEESIAISTARGDEPAQTAALNNLALVHRDRGDLDTALALTERALGVCAAYGDRHRQAALENNLADLHHAAGREKQALAHLKRAVAIFSDIGGEEATRLPEIWKLVSW